MKKKVIYVGLIIAIVLAVVLGIYWFVFRIPDPKFNSGYYVDNKEDFYDVIDTETSADTVAAYLKNIEYTVDNIDKKGECVTLTVYVPVLSEILKNSINNYVDEVSEENYDEILTKVKSEVAEMLESGQNSTISETFTIPIIYEERKWFIVQSDEFYNFISEPFYQALVREEN